jgi:tryptophanyl-tRNA synthetase
MGGWCKEHGGFQNRWDPVQLRAPSLDSRCESRHRTFSQETTPWPPDGSASSRASAPPGSSTSGTIFGAIRNAVALQDSHEAILFIADLHAITDGHAPAELSEHTLATAALYLACGVDPLRATLFVQSQVPAHAQMARLLGPLATVGMLRRMIQFKEHAERQGHESSLALLDYPVLMAADILLYDADLVPVGADQMEHLQLARELAARCNRRFGSEAAPVLKVPQPYVVAAAARVMSLADGMRKMSKSDPSDAGRINLLDTPDQVRAKIRRAKTDSALGLEFDNPTRPEAHNLLTLYLLLSGRPRGEVAAEAAGMGYGAFKAVLTEAVNATLAPIRQRYAELRDDPGELMAVLDRGRQRAAEVAGGTLARVAAAMGFVPPVGHRGPEGVRHPPAEVVTDGRGANAPSPCQEPASC